MFRRPFLHPVNQVAKFMTDRPISASLSVSLAHRLPGKSLIASTLYRTSEQVGDEHIGVIPEDSYYKDQSHLSMKNA